MGEGGGFLFTPLTLEFHLLVSGRSGLDFGVLLFSRCLHFDAHLSFFGGFLYSVCGAGGGALGADGWGRGLQPPCVRQSLHWLAAHVGQRRLRRTTTAFFLQMNLRGEELRGGGRGLKQEVPQMSEAPEPDTSRGAGGAFHFDGEDDAATRIPGSPSDPHEETLPPGGQADQLQRLPRLLALSCSSTHCSAQVPTARILGL